MFYIVWTLLFFFLNDLERKDKRRMLMKKVIKRIITQRWTWMMDVQVPTAAFISLHLTFLFLRCWMIQSHCYRIFIRCVYFCGLWLPIFGNWYSCTSDSLSTIWTNFCTNNFNSVVVASHVLESYNVQYSSPVLYNHC